MALDEIAVGVDRWAKDPAGPVADLLRELATQVETAERIMVPRHTGRTFESIHVESAEDPDGSLVELIGSRNPVTDVLNASRGYIRNRRPGRGRRGKKDLRIARSGVRPAHPFAREAVHSVAELLSLGGE